MKDQENTFCTTKPTVLHCETGVFAIRRHTDGYTNTL